MRISGQIVFKGNKNVVQSALREIASHLGISLNLDSDLTQLARGHYCIDLNHTSRKKKFPPSLGKILKNTPSITDYDVYSIDLA